ncbi:MAG TPA: FAD-dependent oxidoreductase [Solirubrobacteraceae bacterium]|nr:FAD-dependent oxidoreductase [Solirubrobacteraceae bacterium]
MDPDVIVVGGGGSGLSAAVAAAQQGLRVVVLEKNPHVGGSTALSVGSFAAAGTSLQRRQGIEDSAERFMADARLMNGEDLERRDNVALREVLIREAAGAFEALRGIGVQFFGPTEQPPWTVRRMHQVVPNSRAYVGALRAEAERRRVEIRVGAPARRLLVEDGRVVGVDAGQELRARLGVVLAAGDYSANAEMKADYAGAQIGRLPPVNPTNTGDGFRMAADVGAALRNMDRVAEELRFSLPAGFDVPGSMPTGPKAALVMRVAIERLPKGLLRVISRRALTSLTGPSPTLFSAGAILVDADAKRFGDELTAPARALGDLAENRCYAIFDGAVGELFSGPPNHISTFPGIAYAYIGDYLRIRPDATHVAPTLADVARGIDVDPEALQATVERYNALARAGRDDDFGRATLGAGLLRPPFYALGPLIGRVIVTDGGLAVDQCCRVLDERGAAIEGLHAVGANGQGGLVLRGHGMHIGWAMTSGRIAAASVARSARP